MREAALAPVDVAGLVAFRVMFGLVLLWEVWRYFTHGWIAAYWIAPAVRLPYPGFGWLPVLPGAGMYGLWAVMGALAALITVGGAYRLAAPLFTLAFAYQFLLEQGRYLNHFYFIILMSGLLAIVPAHRRWSVDAALQPRLRDDWTPAWTLWLLRFQVGVLYVYAGLAKLGSDWLAGQPMRMWLAQRVDLPVLGRWLADPTVALGAAWLGAALDLLAVPLLLYKRTRVAALVAIATFHVLNARLFTIGVFPVLAMAATLLFCEPDWPRRLLRLPPAVTAPASTTVTRAPLVARRAGVVLLGVYVAAQLLIPLRHYLYSGDVSWTEEGHQFAWRMKLRDKQGAAEFTVIDHASDRAWSVAPSDRLTSWQYEAVATQPQLLVHYAHELARRWAEYGIPGVEVHARTLVSLNGRAPEPLVDPTIDLAALDHCRAPGCILPLTQPLPRTPYAPMRGSP